MAHLVYCSSAESKTHVLRNSAMRCSQVQIVDRSLGPGEEHTYCMQVQLLQSESLSEVPAVTVLKLWLVTPAT